MAQASNAGVSRRLTDAKPRSAWLVPLAGPTLAPIELKVDAANPGAGVVLGRHDDCAARLPADADKVSRFHARFSHEPPNAWRLADLGSRWGTFLNGVRVAPNADMPLHEGDLIRVTPWTFSFRTSSPAQRGLQSFNDTHQNQTLVKSFRHDMQQPLAEDMAALLLESAAGIHAAEDEQALARVLLEIASRGTGLPNAALLRPLDADGRIEVVASRLPGVDLGAGAPDVPRALYSRSLLAAASQGEVAELSDTTGGDAISQSIVQMHINSAICVPLMLGATTAAYLYLDSRSPSGSRLRTLRAGASAFCLALGRMASLALSNLKRIDIERRQAMFEAELSAGAEAQRWILPRRQGTFGLLAYVGESRPGRYVGGDFFDVIPLGESKLAVALGDVSGKGIPASVLMTATQGFLHAALQEHAEPGKAVSALNRFINPRRPESKFVTMWVGVFDLAAGTLTYVDAGHGYGLLLNADGTYDTLDAGGGLPVGVMDTWTYEATTVWLKPGGRALVVSDGIVEQLVNDTDPTTGEPTKRQFELDGVRDALRDTTAGADEVAALFQTLFDQAGTKDLSDDATAVLVRW